MNHRTKPELIKQQIATLQAMAAFDAQAAGQTYGPTAAQLFLEPPLLAASH